MKYDFVNEEAKRLYGGEISLATQGSAGFDLRAYEFCDDGKISTGVKVAIPYGMVGFLLVRSSIGFKHGHLLSNAVGVIDSDYRGIIYARLAKVQPIGRFEQMYVKPNIGDEKEVDCQKLHPVQMPSLKLCQGERFCQLVIVPCNVLAEYSPSLDDTDRGEGGIGSTGNA